ncbi:2-oxo acid dehydrogenase subunit E2 [Halospeciosus flavus]|uniref:2-oxo acid dehydrogenase subunit E2 n=1 Tax=Halospeciosus flavus TaxID=3032283 RepID=A0ABD5Z7D9_9EURY|nr:2-oxo acid dehydrogenase subunit E2 [Halospeciosus flavus]
MPREFKLPDVGEGVAEGEIVEWLVEEGDPVSEDQPVAEVETDKAVVEVPSPVDGTVQTLHYEAGDVVPVGSVIVTFAVEGEEAESAESEAESEEPATEEPSEVKEAVTRIEETESEEAETEETEETGPSRSFAPPSVRRLARELGVDLDEVSGSGPSGRVTEGDVRAAAAGTEEAAAGVEESEVDSAAQVPMGEQTAHHEEAGAAGDVEGAVDVVEEEPAGAEGVEAAARERTLAAPATRKLAEDLGVDLNEVPATGENEGEEYVTPEDVRRYAEAQEAKAETEAPAEAAETAESTEVAEAGPEAERVPYKGIRRTIGQQMAKSKYTAPHVSVHDTAEVSSLVKTRADLKERAAERGVKLTYLPFVVKAVVAGLKEYPILNSTLDEENEEIVKKGDYNVGVAVATDAGLMVPVVKDADEKGILDIAEEVNELAQKARERTISREEMQGGTFTITNFGAVGSAEYATPIINYPETAILGLGSIEERPVAEDGEVVARETLPLSLSVDHRVIDGAEATKFANEVMAYLNNPSLLLLE